MNNNTNFIAFLVISVLILVGFHYLYEKPHAERMERQALITRLAQETHVEENLAPAPVVLRQREDVLQDHPRVRIDTPALRGSINLVGARLDDLELRRYRETVDPNSPEIVLLSPAGSEETHGAYYASFGWLAARGVKVPSDQTLWKSDDRLLSIDKPVRLTWDNGEGLIFERVIAVDENYLFTIADRVTNKTDGDVALYPFGLIARYGRPPTAGTYVLHEGPIAALNGTLKELTFANLVDESKIAIESTGGWLGITDKYWLVTLMPPQTERFTASFTFVPDQVSSTKGHGIYQTDFRGAAVSLAAGTSIDFTTHLFAGAKRVTLLDQYAKQLGLPLFDRTIDFGWYYFLTKPFLYLLIMLHELTGNMGIAIILFTIMLKIVTLPLSIKSYRSMAKLKALQPEMKEIQERYKGDRPKIGMETMELYKREKVSPMSGCVPILIQIPIFFALYKVLYVGIEMRQAPLFGWVQDMSVADPSSVLTLFGLIDWAFIPHVGIWPLLMGISMFVQQKMTPQPTTENAQMKVLMWMPVIFTFMLANMAVGLVFYWTISNVFGIAQQWYITRKVIGTKTAAVKS
ncbi:MAG: membrane protein insertase YidC [Alphaproteobacteria bacterium]|nr:membrane protein insertase YidC [Alphaproteobacteria bacterium]